MGWEDGHRRRASACCARRKLNLFVSRARTGTLGVGEDTEDGAVEAEGRVGERDAGVGGMTVAGGRG
jgi:hypothetical protein